MIVIVIDKSVTEGLTENQKHRHRQKEAYARNRPFAFRTVGVRLRGYVRGFHHGLFLFMVGKIRVMVLGLGLADISQKALCCTTLVAGSCLQGIVPPTGPEYGCRYKK
jgi:hypothetical protein